MTVFRPKLDPADLATIKESAQSCLDSKYGIPTDRETALAECVLGLATLIEKLREDVKNARVGLVFGANE